jgi:hypothetical protein
MAGQNAQSAPALSVVGVAGWWVRLGSVDGQEADQGRDASRDLVQLCCFVIAVRLAEVAAAEDDRVETTEARIQVAEFDRSVLAAWCGDDWWFLTTRTRP